MPDDLLIKKEISCRYSIYPILKYLELKLGFFGMREVLEPIGLTIDFLLDRSNWVSFSYYSLLLEKLVEIMNDVNIPYKLFFELDNKSLLDNYYSSYPVTFFYNKDLGFDFIFKLLLSKKVSCIGNLDVDKKHNNFYIFINLNSQYKKFNNLALSFKGFICSILLGYKINKFKITEIYNKKNSLDMYIFKVKIIDNYIKDDSLINTLIVNTINSIESDYMKLAEKNNNLKKNSDYSIIMNKIQNLFNGAVYFNPALYETLKIIIEEFNCNFAVFFQYDIDNKIFSPVLNINNDKMNVNITDIYLNKNNTELKKDVEFNNIIHILQYSFINKHFTIKSNDANVFNESEFLFYLIPISNKDLFLGFVLFITIWSIDLNDRITIDLFKYISEIILNGYKKISSRNIIEDILTSIPAYVIIFDPDSYEVKYVNNIFVSAFPNITSGLTKDDIIGKDLFSLLNLNNNNLKKMMDFIDKLKTSDRNLKQEINLDANVLEFNYFLISKSKKGEILAGIIINDITEAKYFQDSLLINEKLIALGKVASGIAHEINNPLYAVLSFAEDIRDEKSNSKKTIGYAKEIVKYVMNISDIVKDLSSYSKSLRKEESDNIDINQVIEDSLKIIKYSADSFKITIVKELDCIPIIKAKKGELQQVFINLINNAIQSMNEEGELIIKSQNKKNKILISITDNGCGIPKENINKIFNLYFTTKEPGKGTGQGLHIVKNILDKYNASIKVSSAVGTGTTFYLEFIADKNNL